MDDQNGQRMDNERVHHEFQRMALTEQLGKDRRIVNQYEEGLAHTRGRIEETRYELGILDERLGGLR